MIMKHDVTFTHVGGKMVKPFALMVSLRGTEDCIL